MHEPLPDQVPKVPNYMVYIQQNKKSNNITKYVCCRFQTLFFLSSPLKLPVRPLT